MPTKQLVTVVTPDTDTKQVATVSDEEITLACPGGHDIPGTKSKKGLAFVFNCAQHRFRAIVPLSSPLFKE